MRSTCSAVWWLPFAGLWLAGCPGAIEGGVRAVVSFTRAGAGPACIRVGAADVARLDGGTALRATTDVPISDLGSMGQVTVGIGRGTDWSNELEITASLHPGGCTAPSVAVDSRRVVLAPNTLPTVELTLNQRAPDGGNIDGGPRGDGGHADSGADSGTPDGGLDAGPFDSGAEDAGFDAGPPFDAGRPDAGFDSGVVDAGPPCSGQFFALPPPQSETYNDVAMFNPDVALLAGNSGNLVAMIGDGGFERWNTNTCNSDFKALWVRTTTQIFVAASGRVMRFSGPASCTDNVASLRAGQPTAMANYPLGVNTRLWVSSVSPSTIHGIEINTAGAQVGSTTQFTPNMGLPVNESQISDLDGTSDSNVFAVGHFNNNGFILKLSDDKQSWAPVSVGMRLGRVNTIAFASTNVAFAGGEALLVFDGGSWQSAGSAPFEIFGLKVLSANSVIAVGDPNGTNFGIARWNGSSWTNIQAPAAGGARLLRVDATSACDAWAVGANRAVLTSNDRP